MQLGAIHVWALLVSATGLSWFLTEDTAAARLGATAVIAIAAFKIHMVVGHFMELGWQPRPFRFIVTGWIMAVTAIIIGGYWAA